MVTEQKICVAHFRGVPAKSVNHKNNDDGNLLCRLRHGGGGRRQSQGV
jgi:hypothetical protein